MRLPAFVLLAGIVGTACVTAGDSRDELRARELESQVDELQTQLRAEDRKIDQAFQAASRAVEGLGRLDCAAITAPAPVAVPRDGAALVRWKSDKPHSVRGRFQPARSVSGRAIHVAACEETSP